MEVALARIGKNNRVREDNSREIVMAGVNFYWFWVLRFSLGYKAKNQGGVAGAKTGLKSSAWKGKVPSFL
jgi:hypothetical protein